jgi:hypothetical protein
MPNSHETNKLVTAQTNKPLQHVSQAACTKCTQSCTSNPDRATHACTHPELMCITPTHQAKVSKSSKKQSGSSWLPTVAGAPHTIPHVLALPAAAAGRHNTHHTGQHTTVTHCILCCADLAQLSKRPERTSRCCVTNPQAAAVLNNQPTKSFAESSRSVCGSDPSSTQHLCVPACMHAWPSMQVARRLNTCMVNTCMVNTCMVNTCIVGHAE